jgi:predicted membrane channel-forming protein YqfA (hemolysin III family)
MGESPPPDRKEFVGRVGTFFILVGIGLMVFFLLSESAKHPTLSYFCWGTVLLTFGFIFHGRFKRAPGPPHGRFSILKRLKPKPKEKKEEKKK